MSLRGNLNSVDLANIFQMLSINQKEGTLNIFDGDSKKSIYFSRDGVSMLSRGKAKMDTLGRILLRYDRISESQLEKTIEKQRQSGRLLAPVLEESGLVSREEIEDALRIQIEEEIYNLFIWKDASFEFIEGAPPKEFDEVDGTLTRLTFNVNSLIMEAARRIDEWEQIERIVKSTNEVYQYSGRNIELTDEIFREPYCEKVLAGINGRNTIEEIVEQSCVNKFEVCKIIALLTEQGALEPVSMEELKAAADAAIESGAVAEAVKFLERIVELGGENTETHLSLGRAYEAMGRIAGAADHYRKVAESKLAAGSAEESFEYYRQIVEMLPTDLQAGERLIEVFVNHPDEIHGQRQYVIERGKKLASIFLEIGKNKRAIQTLHRVISLDREDFVLRNLLVNIYLASNMSSEAIAEYEAMADWYTRRRDWEQVIRILRKVLVIDRSREDLSQRLENLLMRKEKKHRNIRRFIVVVVVLLGLSVFGYGYISYELDARQRTAEAETTATRMLEKLNTEVQPIRDQLEALAAKMAAGNADLDETVKVYRKANLLRARYETRIREAIGKLEAVASDYKFARAKQEAVERQADLAKMQDIFEASVANVKREIQTRALKFVADGDRKARDGQCTEALALYRKAWDIAIDRAPLEARAVPAKIADGEKYVTTVRETQQRIDHLFASADYDGARAAAMDILTLYFTSELLHSVDLPLRVESEPPGAHILVNGSDAGVVTPGWVRWHPGDTTRISLELHGFLTGEKTIPPVHGNIADRELPRIRALENVKVELVKEVEWTDSVDGSVEAAPAVQGDVAFVPTRASAIWRLDLATKEKRLLVDARSASVSGFRSTPVIGPDGLYLATVEGIVRCVSPDTGKTKWEAKTKGMVYAPLTVADDYLLVADDKGTVYAWHATTGKPAWQARVSGEIRARPVVRDGMVYTVTAAGRLFVHRLEDGKAEWDIPIGSSKAALFGAPLVTKHFIYVGSCDRKLHAIDAETHKEVWAFDTGAEVHTAPSLMGETLVVATVEGTLFAVRDGSLLDRLEVGGTMRAAPTVVGDQIVLVNDSGRLINARFDRGRFVTSWKYDLHSGDGSSPRVQASPVIVGSRIVVLSDAGEFFVLDE